MANDLSWVEQWAKQEMIEWACNSQRGLEYPGSWSPFWGPMPDDWIKDKCQQVDCPRCAEANARVMVSGSRGWTDKRRIHKAFLLYESWPPHYTLIHGGARGADRLAASVAEEMGWRIQEYPAKWEEFGKAAGFIRNKHMLDSNPEHVFIFWDGSSPGTQHVLDDVVKRGISHEVHISE